MHFNQEGCAELYNPCLDASSPQAAMPFYDPTQGRDARAADAQAVSTQTTKFAVCVPSHHGDVIQSLFVEADGAANWQRGPRGS